MPFFHTDLGRREHFNIKISIVYNLSKWATNSPCIIYFQFKVSPLYFNSENGMF